MASPNANLNQGDQPPQPPPPPQPPMVPKPSILQLYHQDPPTQFTAATTTSTNTISNEQLPKSPSPNPSPRSGRHHLYKGIRIRSGKWVSEIREPRKTNRIWLGTYPTPEMAAAAYDVAALALKGPETTLNFPESLTSYPKPTSTSASHIQAAASTAAAARAPSKQEKQVETGSSSTEVACPKDEEAISSSSTPGGCQRQEYYFIDEEELLNMPSLLVDMAEGMLVSPPRIMSSPNSSDDSPRHSDAESLWSYK